MTSAPVYVPIIKGKLNDLRAVGALSSGVREIIKPLIETMPVNREKNTTEEHVFKFCDYIRKHVPLGEVFVDFFGLFPDESVEDGTNAIIYGYRLLKSLGRTVTPVYGLERNDDLWEELGKLAMAFGKGFTFRLRRDDLADYLIDETWGAILERTAQMGLRPQDVDILLDFADLSDTTVSEITDIAYSFLWHNQRIRDFRSVIVAGSSALKTVTDVGKDDQKEVLRTELHLWSELWRDMPDDFKPVYGDYGVIHPDFSDLGPNKYMNAKIRYTAGDKILYFRGHGLLHPEKDYVQYHGLASLVRSDTRFRGRGYSFGDAYLDNCAQRQSTHGSPATWVKADMNHHLTYVALQVGRLIPAFMREDADAPAEALIEAV